MSGPVVQSRIKIDAEDRTKQAMQSVAKNADDIGKRFHEVADKSGDAERGIKGVKDILGSLGGQQLADVADKFGGIEGILKGFPGILGPIAAGVAGIGALAYAWYEHTRKTEIEAAKLRADEVRDGAENLNVLAAQLHVSEKLLSAGQQAATVEQARASLIASAKQVEQSRADLIEAQAEGEEKAVASARKKLTELQNQTAELRLQIEHSVYLQSIDAKRAAHAADASMAVAHEDAEIARIAGVRERETERQAVTIRRLAAAEQAAAAAARARSDAEAQIQTAKRRDDTVLLEAATRRLTQAVQAQTAADADTLRLQDQLRGSVAAVEAEAERVRQQAQQRAEQARARRLQRQREEAAESKRVTDELIAQANAYTKALFDTAAFEKRIADERAAALETARRSAAEANIAAEVDPAKQADLQYMEDRRRALIELAQVESTYYADQTRGALELAAVRTRLANLDAAQDRKTNDRKKKEARENQQLAIDVTETVVAGIAQTGVARKAEAAFMTSIAIAKGALAVADKGPAGLPQLAAGIFSAAQFAIAAGSSPPAAPTGFGAGSSAPSLEPTGTGGGNITINVSGAVVGTAQEVGKSVNKALSALNRTGYGAKAGA